MIIKPSLSYNGIALVLSRPSRFDSGANSLLTGYASDYFFNACIGNGYRRQSMLIQTADEGLPALPNTKAIFLLGEESLRLVKPNAQLNAWRGSPISLNNDQTTAIATYQPQDAFDRRGYDDDFYGDDEDASETEAESELDSKDLQRTKRRNWKYWMWNDTRKLIHIYKYGQVSYAGYNYRMMPDANEVISILQTTKNQYLTIDIETNPQTRRMLCISFTFNPLDVDTDTYRPTIYCVPIQRFNNTLAYDETIVCRIFVALAIAFRDNVVIGHNLGFDLLVLAYYYGIPFPKQVFDTMLAQHRLSPETEKSLGHCISLYLHLPYHKDEGIFTPHSQQQEQQLWAYNAKDVYTTYLLRKHLLKSASFIRGADISIKQANDSLRCYLTMTMLGCRLDTDNFCKVHDDFRREQELYERMLNIVVGRNLNPRSPKQVSEYFYTQCKFPMPQKNPTEKLQLLKLYLKHGIPSAQIIYLSRIKSKLAGSMEFKLHRGNRATGSYAISGTDTYRLGSRAIFKFRSDKGIGTNMQNWTKKLRRYIIPDECKKFIQIDQAGAEALIVAYLVQNGNFRSLFLNKIKPHVFVAMHLVPDVWAKRMNLPDINEFLSLPIDRLKLHPRWKELEKLIKDSDNAANPAERYYYIGKTVCHASNYDMKAPTFQRQAFIKSNGMLRLEIAFCKQALITYTVKLFPEIPIWHMDVLETLKTNSRTLHNLFGFPRRFYGYWDESLFKQAYAFVPQSTVGTITNVALTEIQNDIEQGKYPGLDILQNGHDSGLFQAPIDKCEIYATELVKHFRRPLTSLRGESFNMGAEVQIGMNWQPESQSNPNGMKNVNI